MLNDGNINEYLEIYLLYGIFRHLSAVFIKNIHCGISARSTARLKCNRN